MKFINIPKDCKRLHCYSLVASESTIALPLLFFNAISEIYLPDALSIAAGEVALPAAGQLEAPGVGAALRAAGGVIPLYQPGVGPQGVAGEGGLGQGGGVVGLLHQLPGQGLLAILEEARPQ